MVYAKQTWADKPATTSPLSAERLNHMEAGIEAAAAGAITITTQVGTAYTLVLADAGTLVRCDNADPITVTVPTNATVAFPVGTRISFEQAGAGQVTCAGDAGVTVDTGATGTLTTAEQHAVVELVQVAVDTWLLYGDREAAA